MTIVFSNGINILWTDTSPTITHIYARCVLSPLLFTGILVALVLGCWEKVTHFLWHLIQFYKYSGHIPCFAWKMYLHSCQNDGQGENDRKEHWSLLVITYNSPVGIMMCWWDKLCPILEHIKFVSRTHMTSLGCLTSFIIDANLFRADWWQHFLPFTELELGFIKGLKLPAN